MAKKKKTTAKEKRAQTLQARIDAARGNEMKRQMKAYQEGALEAPAKASPEPEDAMPEAPASCGETASVPAAPKPEKKQSRRQFRPSLLRPGDPLEREDGRTVCPVALSVRMTLEEMMRTLRKEDPEGTGRAFIRTDGTECLGNVPHMTYWYERGLFLRADQLTGKNRNGYVLADMLSRSVKGIFREQREDGTADWYITLSPAMDAAPAAAAE